jgi:thioredoxin reductase (NADPH)
MTRGGLNEPAPTLGAGLPETVNRDGAFPRLDADQRRRLEALGIRRAVRAGDVLFAAGNVPRYFFIVESGMVMIVQGAGRENRVVAVHGHHRFLGELATLMGHRHLLSAVVRDPGEVIQVPVEKLRNVVAEDKALSDVLLRAFILRRSILIEAAAGITVIGSRFSNDARRLREFLARNRIPHQWMDVEKDAGAETLLETLGVEPDQTPVVIGGDATIWHNPTNSELGAAMGLSSTGPRSELSDVIIVGSGPAGLTCPAVGLSSPFGFLE